MSSGKSPLELLKDRLGSIVSIESDDLYSVSYDGLKISFMPEAVIRPVDESTIGVVLKIANKFKIPVTTRGAGSSLTGSAAPIKGGWVLDLSLMNDIEIDEGTGICRAGAGAKIIDIQEAAEKKGLRYPPDPSSHKWSTIGGNIACNAGGLRCVKYGVTRDYVISLKGYLANGEAVSWGRDTRKFATGYNIRDLWIGSEGTLGVMTRASLRLIPQAEDRCLFIASFQSEPEALKNAYQILLAGITPSVLEFLDCLTVKGAENAMSDDFPFERGGKQAVLLVELDGPMLDVAQQKVQLTRFFDKNGIGFKFASEIEEMDALWNVRRKCSSAMFELGNAKLNEDVAVPLDKLEPLYLCIENLRKTSGLPIAVFGHVGDGNLHVNIMYDRGDDIHRENAKCAVQQLMEDVVSLNGAISGEHGVGLAKSSFMEIQFNKAEIDAMKAIKKALDPNGILNPGKWFDPFIPWEHTPEKVRLAWDHK